MVRSVALCLALAGVLAADDKPASLWVASMKEGQTGTFRDKKGKPASLEVMAVIERDVLLVANKAERSKWFAIELDRHGLAEGSVISDLKATFKTDVFKVTGTTKKRGSTYFYVEPFRPKK